ncbi:MAG: hypothetical protein BA873_05115 [Desulfobulbaceae bacterium C00003063]|nr:MAG: hypothetical protein BA873_05115 [Desulfobulbaceae bacterium C00003063]
MEKFRLSLILCHGLLVGGQTSGLLVDAATARESCGAPMIPASAVKGALRIEFERFIAGLGRDVCHPDRPENACNPDNPCIACRLFGAPGKEGTLRFSDALLQGVCRKWFADEERHEIYDRKPTGRGYIIRQGITINRMRKVAEEKMLFNIEALGPLSVSADESESQMLFVSEIEAGLPLTKEELELLQVSTLSLTSIGANKSRGMGRVHAHLEPVETSVSSVKASSSQVGTDVCIILVADEYIRVSGIKTANNFLETTEYIPGSAVRGAVAASFAGAYGGWDAPAVREAFLKKPAQFSNFYPSTIKIDVQPKPIPISARTCKDYPGFQKHIERYETQASHGAKDTLIAATIVKLLREVGMPAVLKVRCSHPLSGNKVCEAVLKPLTGFYRFPSRDGQTCENLQRRITTKTAINRARFTSAEEQLYSYELIDTRLESSDTRKCKR